MPRPDELDAITLDDLRATRATKWNDPDVPIGAFVAEMDFGIAPEIRAALHEAVDAPVHGYMPPHIDRELREATAEHLNARGWGAQPEDVFPMPDVITAFELAIELFSRPGSKVIVPTPSYMPFLFVPPELGREVIEVPLVDDAGVARLDLDAIQAAFDAGGQVLVLCNPFNPVGRVFTRDELVAISEVVARNDGRVFADEIWAPLVFEGEMVSYATVSDAAASHTVTALSASKAWNLPGLKCAQLVVSNLHDRAVMDEKGGLAGHGTANLGAIANAVAYREGGAWLADVRAYLDGSRTELAALVADRLPGVRFTAPQGTYVGWLDFRGTGIEDPAAFFRENAGVGLTDGAACGAAGSGFVRLIFATPRPVLREMVDRMARAMA
ncbi:MalY/PatB family protein [Microbacterium indicum]|uniref:MalY/PatB family protein n=1 Tax=Microbacterium indicum TaxID=358100 RepID=UPI000411B89A|nr:aminotransferase class I/II-fold pyridoxal phosphate-dependent enzyme [Microbacterium indicum]